MFFLLGTIAVLGFSSDDSKVAYIETGESEGKGEPFANLHVIETAKNTDKVTSFEGDDAEKKAQAAAKATAWVAPKPVTLDEHGAMSAPSGEPLGNVQLKMKKAKGKSCDQGFEPHTVDLTLFLMDDDTPIKAGSAKAACRSECKVDAVHASHHKGALFLVRCSAPGFEGKSEVVTPFAKKLASGLNEDLPPQ
jgi:predicted secreted protein